METATGPVMLSGRLSRIQVVSPSKFDIVFPAESFCDNLDQETAQICEATAKYDAVMFKQADNYVDQAQTSSDELGLEVSDQFDEGGVSVGDNESCDKKGGTTPIAGGEISSDKDESIMIYPLMSVEQDEDSALTQDNIFPVELATLQYCEVELELLDRPVKVLNHSGAQISLIKPSVLEGLDISSHGNIAIRGIIGPSVEVPRILLRIRPFPGHGFESIAPFIDVTLGVCDMTTDVDIILSDLVIQQLDALNAYTVVKPAVSDDNRSDEIQNPHQVCETLVDAVASPNQEDELTSNNVIDQVITEGDSNVDDDDALMKFVTSSSQNTNDAEAQRLRSDQRKDTNLNRAWTLAEKGKGNFYIKDDLLFHRDQVMGQKVEQICVPTNRREEICHSAHDLSHQGYKCTKERIKQNFFRPEMNKTIKEYVDSCLQCQQKARALVKDRIPISVVPRDQVPFSHIYIWIALVHFLTRLSITTACV